MRLLLGTVSVLAFSLACGGGGFTPKASVGDGTTPSTLPPPPPPEVIVAPAPAPAAAPTGDLLAVVGPFAMQDVAIVCTRAGAVVDCPVGPCAEGGECAPGEAVRAVGMATDGAEALEIPVGTARLSAFREEFCEGVAAEFAPTEGGARKVTYETVPDDDPALAPLKEMVGADGVGTAWRLDVDGDGSVEVLAAGSNDEGGVLVLLRPGAAPATVFDTRRESLSEDADDQARMEYDMNQTTLTWLGVTDAQLDGTLEIVAEGSGYESSWIVVMRPDGTTLGSLGCAI